jgi:hypothetical protein
VNKVASKANAVMMVGYAADRGGRQAYRVYDFKKKRVFIRRHLKPWRSTTAAPIQIGDAAFRQFVREREAFGIKIPPHGAHGAPPLTALEQVSRTLVPLRGDKTQVSTPGTTQHMVAPPTLRPLRPLRSVGAGTATPCAPVGATTNKTLNPNSDGATPPYSGPVGEHIWKRFTTGVFKGRIIDFSQDDKWPYTVKYTDNTTATYTMKEMCKIRKQMRKIQDPEQPVLVTTPMANLMTVPLDCPILHQNRKTAPTDMLHHFGTGFEEVPAFAIAMHSITPRDAIKLAGLDDRSLKDTLARDFQVPMNLFEAVNGRAHKHWLPVIRKELNQIVRTETFRIVKTKDVPRGRRIITGKMVLAVKRNKKGYITKLKARFVAHGFRQQYGKDYHSTFAPTVHKASLRLMLSLGARNQWKLKQFDVKGAFLLSDLKYAIFLRPPKLVAKLLNMAENEVWELQKTLYGLKQSAHRWHQDFTAEMIRLGFTACPDDACLFRRSDKRGELIIGVHVDDCVVIASNNAVFDNFMKAFKYPCSDVGPLDYCLGLRVDYDGKTITLSQSADIEALAARYGVLGTRKVRTPMDPKIKFMSEQCPQTEKDQAAMAKIPYRNLLGALQYAAWNRPDIACSVNKLAQYCNNPGKAHWAALRRVLIYLYHSRHHGMTFGNRRNTAPKTNLISFWVDSDHAGDLDDNKSRTGLIIKCAGDTIECLTKKQKACTNSTAWAETKAIGVMARKLGFYRRVLAFLGYPQSGPVNGFTDSAAALALQDRGFVKYQMNHLRCDFQQVHDAIKEKRMNLQHIAGNINPSDVLTKALPWKFHNEYMKFMLNIL